MPFRYDLRLSVSSQNGELHEEVIPLGIKRFYCEGRSFRLEGKRIVLRGLHCDFPTEDDLRLARKCEIALIVQNADEDVHASASRFGVPLVVDLRDEPTNENFTFHQFDWQPAVMLLILSVEQLQNEAFVAHRPRESYVVACVGLDDVQPNVRCDAYAVELDSGQRPPAWATACGKPVIAIRKSVASEIKTARASCDSLQAELAPEFDLAGYFV
jgi:hypothetical protein